MDGGTPIDSLNINNNQSNHNDTDFVNQIMTEFASTNQNQQQQFNPQIRQPMPQVQAKFTPQLENNGNSDELLPNDDEADNEYDDDNDNYIHNDLARGSLLKQLNDPALVLVLFIVFNFEPVTNLIDNIIGKYTKTPYVSLVVRAFLVATVYFLIKKFI